MAESHSQNTIPSIYVEYIVCVCAAMLGCVISKILPAILFDYKRLVLIVYMVGTGGSAEMLLKP